MKWSEFRTSVIKLINSSSTSGNLIPTTDSSVVDSVLRLPQLYNAVLLEIATTAKYIHKKKSISQNPIPNQLLMPLTTFDVQQHLSTDLTDMSAKGSQSYCFKVDNVATIYIEEEFPSGTWTVLNTINHTTPKGEFTQYKGFTGCTDVTRNVRVRFGGNYPYNVRDKALFAYLFPTVDDIPNYEKYRTYTMPTDFYLLNKVVNNGNNMLRQNTVDWEFQGRNEIAVNYFLVGGIDIFYYAYPTEVPETPSDDYVLQLDNEANQASVFGVAALILMDDPVGKSTSTNLMALYQNKLANMVNAVTKGSTSVSNSLFTTDNTFKLF